jgi:Ca-activated chloride channel family protein
VKDALSKEKGAVVQDGQLYTRGGRGNETKYYVDGQPVKDPHAGKEQGWGTIHGLSGGGPPASPPVHPTTGGTTLPNDEVYDSMFFQHYGVNPFIPTDEDALSTFAVDVDAAAYTVARRYIEERHLPPPDAARVEEFVNFFRQDYPDFTSPDFRIFLEGAPSPYGAGYHLVRVGIKARQIAERDRKPASLVFVIDVSGSMAREDRLALVKRALRILVDELRPSDSVGIVVYGSNGRVLLDPTWAENRRRILDAIDGLYPDGSTNAEEGLLLGYEMARREYRRGAINKIILCSDGVANVGRTGAESIFDRVRREADEGIELTTVGFGMGNYNDVLMEQLADKGDGNYYYVDDLDEARRVFEENLTGTLQTVARDAKVQVEFDPRVVTRYRLLGFENRDVADRDFRNDRVDAGEIGAGHEVTALYEVKLADGARDGRVATVRFRYARPERARWDERDDRGGRDDDSPHRDDIEEWKRREAGLPPDVREIEAALDVRRLARDIEDASPRFRLDAVVAEFAEILRKSYWARDSRIEDLVREAQWLAHELRGDPAVAEFARLVDRAADLSATLSPEERDREAPAALSPDEEPDRR